MKESLVLGAGTGALLGAAAGSQSPGDPGENALEGAVIGAIIGGTASYFIHGSLETRDANVRKETLLNLEKYDVLGREAVINNENNIHGKGDKCYTTQNVDGRLVSIPCHYVDDPNEAGSK